MTKRRPNLYQVEESKDSNTDKTVPTPYKTAFHKSAVYKFKKFDSDYNLLETYHIADTKYPICTCPAGIKPKCRHRTMLELFKASSHIGDGWFWDYDNGKWVEPLGLASELGEV